MRVTRFAVPVAATKPSIKGTAVAAFTGTPPVAVEPGRPVPAR
ncbi:hypothetical protein ACFXKK_02755 [Streptomyces globisporus]